MYSRHSMHGLALAGLIAGVLVGCGKDSGPGAASAPRPVPSGNASAEQIAEEARDGIDCPAELDTPPRAPDAPADDVVGVRPGLTYDEARNVVLCTADLLVVSAESTRGFNIKTHGATIRQGFSASFAKPRVEKSSREIMNEMQDDFMARSGNAVRQDMKPGEAKWYVSTMGVPGRERVIAAAREEWFAEGRNPTMDSITQALIKKYGTPTRTQILPHIVLITWIHDPSGRLVPEINPLANSCTAMSDPDGGTSFSPDCGLVVSARIDPMRDNPQLAQSFQVGVADQARGYQAIVDTEQALEAAEMQRRTKQVMEAEKNADAPQL